jgi:hypothetical protein
LSDCEGIVGVLIGYDRVEMVGRKLEDSGTMDTYMDTCEQSKNNNARNSLKL